MSDLELEVKKAVRALLREKQAQVVIGFERGSLALRSRPCFVRKEEDVEKLVWNGFCEANVARYLPKRKGKAIVVAKGCDSRALVELIKENQVARDQLIIIGVPCEGMIDRGRIETEMGRGAILETEEREGNLIVRGASFEKALDRKEYLYDHCKVCTHPVPALYDVLLGQPEGIDGLRAKRALEGEAPAAPPLEGATRAPVIDAFTDVETFGSLDTEERWAYLTQEAGKCIRCYACRNACPMCYCPECFVDSSRPQWVGKSTGLSDTMIFHLVRAFHLAGRCVACGACEQACPMGVDIRKLNRKLQKDVLDLFGHEAGCSLDETAPLATFRIDDPEPLMVEP
jgi:formate dehydrogenase (coenzyme F420) beta subunit